MNDLSVVIPHYGHFDTLIKVLHCLAVQTILPYEVIIVCNGKNARLPDISCFDLSIKCIFLKKNFGFSIACNAGIKKSCGDLIALLNNDAYPDKKWIESIKRSAAEHSECDFFSSKIFSSRSNKIDSAGDQVTPYGKIYKRDEYTLNERSSGYCFGPCAAASVYRRCFFETTGFFSSEYFMYYEDVDLNIRAFKNRLKCWYINDAVVKHDIGNSSLQYRDIKYYLRGRNSLYVLFKNISPSYIRKHFFGFFCVQCEDILINLNSFYSLYFLLGKCSLFFPSIHKLFKKYILKKIM